MLDHDRTHHTRYAASVTAWLHAVGNVGGAARRLRIHPNTLKCRLRRVREVFGASTSGRSTTGSPAGCTYGSGRGTASDVRSRPVRTRWIAGPRPARQS
ncbi:helix-turn-helix domain-containing protein [Streptomyces sp. NPDC021622]|uniref:PucR family transcriptional regulator n=1 Tax=Streptomyces sp. NPDC021622 TaxID=3155013 RepID=UPI00340D94FA